jgi:hypothetical protein
MVIITFWEKRTREGGKVNYELASKVMFRTTDPTSTFMDRDMFMRFR